MRIDSISYDKTNTRNFQGWKGDTNKQLLSNRWELPKLLPTLDLMVDGVPLSCMLLVLW